MVPPTIGGSPLLAQLTMNTSRVPNFNVAGRSRKMRTTSPVTPHPPGVFSGGATRITLTCT